METKKIKIGDIRYVRATYEYVIIEDELTHRHAMLNFQKFAKLYYSTDDINAAVEKVCLNQEVVNFRQHIGGAWYVSVTSGFKCVDIRKYFMIDGQLKPTRIGIGLRMSEWENLVKAIPSIHADRPDIAATVPCYLREDHNNQQGEICNLLA